MVAPGPPAVGGAASETASAVVSVNMCAASESRARLPVRKDPATSASMNPPVNASAQRSARSFAPAPWLCSVPIAAS